MVKYFEKRVEKRANAMIKHKRLFAYIMMIDLCLYVFKLIGFISKYWDSWHMGALFKFPKRKKKEEDMKDYELPGREEEDSRED